MTSPAGDDIVVIGGGVIGLASAWRLAGAGLSVTVCDPAPGGGASHASAGMLAPVAEAHYGEEALLTLNLASAQRWPSFSSELEEVVGSPSGYRQCGSLAVAADSDDKRELDRLRGYHERLGLDSAVLDATECRAREPGLSPRVRGGIWVEGDHQADNRVLSRALLEAVDRCGGRIERQAVTEVRSAGGRTSGVTLADGAALDADTVVLAAGAWARGIAGIPPEDLPPVRPVKGQILRLQGDPGQPLISSNVRGLVRGTSLYLVPRTDGRIVVGATQEEMGFDTTVTAEGIDHLLRHALELVPGLGDLELVETGAGLRPGTPDNAPIIGGARLDGLILATGHHRNGILLTPVTADAVVGLVGVGPTVEAAASFGLDRFADGAAA